MRVRFWLDRVLDVFFADDFFAMSSLDCSSAGRKPLDLDGQSPDDRSSKIGAKV
jgi:hypothetical protein